MGRAGLPSRRSVILYIFQVCLSYTFTLHFHNPMTLIVGQVETLLPELLQAMEDQKAAESRVNDLKSQMIALIESPQTVKTVWGSVTLNNGRRTVKVTDRALIAQITLLKESGIALGKCQESVGDPFITVRKSDR
jgi:hypothetical protein